MSFDSKVIEIKYLLLKNNVRPYLGIGFGRYVKTNEVVLTTIKQKGWGFEPKIGIIIDPKILKSLYIDASLSYFKAKTASNSPEAINMAVGIKYMIGNK